jgi:phospholipid transport system transporter-binding protein
MNEANLNQLGPGLWQLDGSLTLSGVAALAAEGERLAANGEHIELDLAGIHHSSSAGVALLLEWYEQVRMAGGQLHLRHCPEALRRIAELSNVDALLGLS